MNIENKKAYHDYFIIGTLETGIVLKGNEVKSIREGKASIKESWVSVDNGQLIIKQMHIAAWGKTNKFDIDEDRNKVLLAHKMQIASIQKQIKQNGYTVVPLKVYLKDGKVKVLIGLAKGKHDYDKRQVEKDKQIKRDIARYTK